MIRSDKLNDKVRQKANLREVEWNHSLFLNPSFFAVHEKKINENYNHVEYYGEIKISSDKNYFYCLEIEKNYFGNGKVQSIYSTENFYEVTSFTKNGYGNFSVQLNLRFKRLNENGYHKGYDFSDKNSNEYKWSIKPFSKNTYSSNGIKKMNCASCSSNIGLGEYRIKINKL